MTRRALVTGATGFVGTALTARLAEEGWVVRALHRASSDLGHLLALGAECVEGDLDGLDAERMARAADGCDAVFHVGAVIGWSLRDRAVMQRVNVAGSRAVCRGALQAGVGRLVHTSSIAAIGPASGPDDEVEEGRPDHEITIGYLATKRDAEREVRAAAADGLDAVIVNPSVIFGPGDRQNSAAYVQRVMSGRVPFLPPGGANGVGVDDVVDGHLRALERGQSGERYLLCAENLLHAELFERVARMAGRNGSVPRVLPAVVWASLAPVLAVGERLGLARPPFTSDLARTATWFMYGSHAKAAAELGYRPGPLDDALESVVRRLQERPE